MVNIVDMVGHFMTPYPVLYLDYDGPLHDDDVYWHPRRGVFIRTPGAVLFEHMPILESLLAPHPSVRIVLATSWVAARGFSYARRRLSPALQQRVVGATYHSWMNQSDFFAMPRGNQILADVRRRRPRTWLALDNDPAGPAEYQERLILTDDRNGLSDPKVQDTLRERLERDL